MTGTISAIELSLQPLKVLLHAIPTLTKTLLDTHQQYLYEHSKSKEDEPTVNRSLMY